MNFREGDDFDHYKICAHIAQGGTGDVYRALDVLSGREIALKIPLRSVTLDAARYEQFLREIEAMRILQHPTVQRGIESGRYDSTPYLVTDWVEGKSLRRLVKENGTLSIDRAISLNRKIAEGLAYCHEQGIVHRDVKPDNILITNEDQPVILDFGLALTPERPNPGKAAGTPGYVAPEQIEGRRGDKRIDVYSLGATLYEMLVGKPPFTGQDPSDVMAMHLTEAVPRLDKVRPDVSRQLATVVAKCLQRDPDQRYPDMNTLLNDLEHLDEVDIQVLDSLTATPPRPSFFKTQAGQVILLLTATVIGMTLLTLLAVALKH